MISSQSKLISKGLGFKHHFTSIRNCTKWNSVIGLEIHAQIQTNSKLFSHASTNFSSRINSNIALFDLGIPGTLPVLNRHCVEAGVSTALALNCRVNPISYFDRKHYFYADMPCGYQITQQRLPLAIDGALEFEVFTPGVHKTPYKSRVRIKQIQLEQDSGKSLHDTDKSLVDLNRAGIPLLEIVFEPDLIDGEESASLIKELITILHRLQTCTCKMEEGALRVDANVSIHKLGEPYGVRTEIKNIGSIRGVAAAINYEIARQKQIKNKNGILINETRAWNSVKKITESMRDKEVNQDYRYMPEPNLPPLHISMDAVNSSLNDCVILDQIKQKLPEMPNQSRLKLINDLKLTREKSNILIHDHFLFTLFEQILKCRALSPNLLANILINELNNVLNKMNITKENVILNPEYVGDVVELLETSYINRNCCKLILQELLNGNTNSPLEIVNERKWKLITDEDKLKLICQDVLKKQRKAAQDYISGRERALRVISRELENNVGHLVDMTKCKTVLKQLLNDRDF